MGMLPEVLPPRRIPVIRALYRALDFVMASVIGMVALLVLVCSTVQCVAWLRRSVDTCPVVTPGTESEVRSWLRSDTPQLPEEYTFTKASIYEPRELFRITSDGLLVVSGNITLGSADQ